MSSAQPRHAHCRAGWKTNSTSRPCSPVANQILAFCSYMQQTHAELLQETSSHLDCEAAMTSSCGVMHRTTSTLQQGSAASRSAPAAAGGTLGTGGTAPWCAAMLLGPLACLSQCRGCARAPGAAQHRHVSFIWHSCSNKLCACPKGPWWPSSEQTCQDRLHQTASVSASEQRQPTTGAVTFP